MCIRMCFAFQRERTITCVCGLLAMGYRLHSMALVRCITSPVMDLLLFVAPYRYLKVLCIGL